TAMAWPLGQRGQDRPAARRAGPRRHDSILALRAAGGRAGGADRPCGATAARGPDEGTVGRGGRLRSRRADPAIRRLLSAAEPAARIPNNNRYDPRDQVLSIGAGRPNRAMAADTGSHRPAAHRVDVGGQPGVAKPRPLDPPSPRSATPRIARAALRGAAERSVRLRCGTA